MQKEKWHDGRVAIVTGGNAGIGLAVAQVLAKRGARVAVGGRRCADPAAARSVTQAIDSGAHAFALDVSDRKSVAEFYGKVHEALGKPGVLVNAAGISVHQTVRGHEEEDWLDVIDVNLNGPFRMIHACLPNMMSAGWGRIVNIASTAATTAMPSHAAYCASKSGLLGLSRAVALEGAPHGVVCTTVSPTWVETDMLRESAAKMALAKGRTTADEIAGIAAANPQNRLVQPNEIAELVSFLCSDLAPALTKEDIQINAGAEW